SKLITDRFADESVASGLSEYLSGVSLWLSDTSSKTENPQMPADSPWKSWKLWRYQEGYYVPASNTVATDGRKLDLGEPSIFDGDRRVFEEFMSANAWDFTIIHDIESDSGDPDLLATPGADKVEGSSVTRPNIKPAIEPTKSSAPQ